MEVRFVVFLCADALDNYIYRAHHPQLIPEMRVTRPVRASKNQIPPRTRGQKNRHHQVGRLSLILHPPPVDPLDQWLRFAHGAISPNTERALRADLGIYRSWCEHRQLIPWPVNATPLPGSSIPWPPRGPRRRSDGTSPASPPCAGRTAGRIPSTASW